MINLFSLRAACGSHQKSPPSNRGSLSSSCDLFCPILSTNFVVRLGVASKLHCSGEGRGVHHSTTPVKASYEPEEVQNSTGAMSYIIIVSSIDTIISRWTI